MISCSAQKKSYTLLKENELFFTRKYIGNYVDHFKADPEVTGGIPLIWIKTTIYPNYGHLSAFGRGCKFSPGDRLFLKSSYTTSGSFGNWVYEIENESSVSYKVNEYRSGDKVLVQNLANWNH
jgi:hypothetical protein